MLKVHKLLGSDLITISIITFIICLILTIGTLYLTQPNWVHTMNMKKGTPELSWLLVFVYSFAFASFAAIIVMVMLSKYSDKRETTQTEFQYKVDLNFPSEEVALARYA